MPPKARTCAKSNAWWRAASWATSPRPRPIRHSSSTARSRGPALGGEHHPAFDQAVSALVNLEFKKTAARAAVAAATAHVGPAAELAELIRYALREVRNA